MSSNPRIISGTCADSRPIVKYRITPVQYEPFTGGIALQLNHGKYRVAGIFTQDALKQFVSELQEYIEE